MDQKLTRVIHAASAYYSRPEAEPRPAHFELWLKSLKEPARSRFRTKSFDECKRMLNFRRFVAEMNKMDMEEYMRHNLSPEDYDFWRQYE